MTHPDFGLWHIGNTTVRSALRLPDALRALDDTGFVLASAGSTKVNEFEFALMLDNQGVAEVTEDRKVLPPDSDRYPADLGRKWRSALTQLGFLTPKLRAGEVLPDGWEPYRETPQGARLRASATLPGTQDCFLRTLLAYQLPSALEPKKGYAGVPFIPLVHTLSILRELHELLDDSRVSLFEFSCVIQASIPEDGARAVAERIVVLRSERAASANRAEFERDARTRVAGGVGLKPNTLVDYADLTFRYLKSTGLFTGSPRSLSIAEIKLALVDAILADPPPRLDGDAYLRRLWDGAALPTDSLATARTVLRALEQKAKAAGLTTPTPAPTSVADATQSRHELEDALLAVDERAFARAQSACADEIAYSLRSLRNKSGGVRLDGEDVPTTGEQPAYLEWSVWRAFLAMNHLAVEPGEVRNFHIAEDMLPVGTASGGQADLVVEFDDYVVVVEVTLTSGSRQEVAERESVKRHVGELGLRHDKPVYGLFIAPTIDLNTSYHFQNPGWVAPDERVVRVPIAPLSLGAFADFLESVMSDGGDPRARLRSALDGAVAAGADFGEAPAEWLALVEELLLAPPGP